MVTNDDQGAKDEPTTRPAKGDEGAAYRPYGHQYNTPPPYHQQNQYGGWGWYYSPHQYKSPKAKKKRSSKPAIAGALLITAGILAILMGGFFGTMFMNFSPLGDGFNVDSSDGIGSVEGHIIYQNASPAEGVTITVADSGQMAISNATGYYKLIGVPAGWHDLKVEKEGFQTLLQDVYINNEERWGDREWDDDTQVDFQLQPGSGTMRVGEIHDDEDWDFGKRGVDAMRTMATICIFTSIVFGAIAVIGGYLALKRRHLPVVIICSVFGVLSFGFGLTTILSIIALFILLLSTNEFDRPKKKKGTKSKEGKKKKGGRAHGPGPRHDPKDKATKGPQGPYEMAGQFRPYQYPQNPTWAYSGPRQY